jgi:hypothetical protein
VEGKPVSTPLGDEKSICITLHVFRFIKYCRGFSCDKNLLFQIAIFSSRAILSSMGGWVLNSLTIPLPDNGFTINICAVAGVAARGIC